MSELYTLIDGIVMNRLHPSTFEIPSQEDKDKIKAGDFVKAGFVPDKSLNLWAATERMWVLVESVQSDVISGNLSCDPLVFDGILELGDPVVLDMDNVLAILPGD